jgi:polyphosphate kinase
VNSLVDEESIDALYRASQDGVQIDLVIRGMCALRPGVDGLSDNIRVRSIVGRFLEHSRVFRFGAGDDAEYWIGSADMMHRNLDRRVEALVRVTLESAKDSLRRVLELSMSDQTEGWDLAGDGTWHRRAFSPSEPHIHLQEALLRRTIGKVS